MLPGRFKELDNRAGGTDFVASDLVEGTLRAGIEVGSGVEDAFARAVYAMFLVTEVHPFADGNGRIARVMMNAELTAAGQSRIIIPTVYRNNYVLALRGATHNGHFEGMLSMLGFAQRYTARSTSPTGRGPKPTCGAPTPSATRSRPTTPGSASSSRDCQRPLHRAW